MQGRIDGALRKIELAAAATAQLFGYPIAMQRPVAQDRQQHPIDMPLKLTGRHT